MDALPLIGGGIFNVHEAGGMEADSAPAPHDEDEANAAASAESPAEAGEIAAETTQPPVVETPAAPEAVLVGRHRVDQVALALLAGIVALLLICVAIALIAWRHAPVNPAIPAAFWMVLG